MLICKTIPVIISFVKGLGDAGVMGNIVATHIFQGWCSPPEGNLRITTTKCGSLLMNTNHWEVADTRSWH